MIAPIHTERLILRRPKPEDMSAALAFFTSDRAKGIGGPMHPGAAWRAFAAEMGHWDIRGFGMWIVTRKGDDRAIAMIGPWCPVDWPETEIGWMIWDASCEGTGIATEAASAAIAHVYGTLGWQTCVHYIAADNDRSIRLAEKLGAVRDDQAPKPDRYPDTLVYRSPNPAGAETETVKRRPNPEVTP